MHQFKTPVAHHVHAADMGAGLDERRPVTRVILLPITQSPTRPMCRNRSTGSPQLTVARNTVAPSNRRALHAAMHQSQAVGVARRRRPARQFPSARDGVWPLWLENAHARRFTNPSGGGGVIASSRLRYRAVAGHQTDLGERPPASSRTPGSAAGRNRRSDSGWCSGDRQHRAVRGDDVERDQRVAHQNATARRGKDSMPRSGASDLRNIRPFRAWRRCRRFPKNRVRRHRPGPNPAGAGQPHPAATWPA